MLSRLRVCFLAVIVSITCLLINTRAYADTSFEEQQVTLLLSQAMADYDVLNNDSAEIKLAQALSLARQSNVSPQTLAKVYVGIAIVNYAKFKDSAPMIANEQTMDAFKEALGAYKNIDIPRDYESPELRSIFEKAKVKIDEQKAADAKAAEEAKKSAEPKLFHDEVKIAPKCQDILIKVKNNPSPKSKRILLLYRSDNSTSYTTFDFKEDTSRKDYFVATIPASMTSGSSVSYFEQILDENNRVVYQDGTREKPHLTTLVGECENVADLTDWGDPIVNFSFQLGTGLGYASTSVQKWKMWGKRVDSNDGANANAENQGNQIYVKLSRKGVAWSALVSKFEVSFNVLKWLQLGTLLRFQLVDRDFIFGGFARFILLNTLQHRVYFGAGISFGRANSIINFDQNLKGVADEVKYYGPAQFFPSIGYILAITPQIGFIVDLSAYVHFPKAGFHVDLTVGPWFQF